MAVVGGMAVLLTAAGGGGYWYYRNANCKANFTGSRIISPYRGGCKFGLADGQGSFTYLAWNGEAISVSGKFRNGELRLGTVKRPHSVANGEWRDERPVNAIILENSPSGRAIREIREGYPDASCSVDALGKEIGQNCTERLRTMLASASPAATISLPATITSPPVSPTETKPSDGSSGSVQPADVATVTKDALNQLLQLASKNDWNGIDAKVRGLKGASYERGDRKVAREFNKGALDLMTKNEFAMAATELEKAIAADPSDIEIRNNLGYAELRLKKFDIALTQLLDTLLIDPTRASGWLNVSEAFAEREKIPAAQASLKLAFHFSRDQAKAITYLAGDESVIPSQKFRAIIQQVQPELSSIPQYGR